MSSPRGVVLVAVFVAGIAGGVVAQAALAPSTPENPYRDLPKVAEPEASAQVATALGSGDARALAKLLEKDALKALGSALEPIVQIEDAKFVGAVEKEGQSLAGYVVKGKDPRGNRFIVGFVLRVQQSKVVGVN